jgi:hypothetical protein
MSAHYQTVEKNMLGAHGLYNGTQYYQQVKGAKRHIQNTGTAAISTVDTDPFPASGCTDGYCGCLHHGQSAAS